MASRKIFDVVATVGKYTERATGQEKKQYRTCGAVFENEDGNKSIKLDTIPIGPEWSGWLQLYEPKSHDGQQRQSSDLPQGRRVSPGMPQSEIASHVNQSDDCDDIPF